jgi:hypothetical protein
MGSFPAAPLEQYVADISKRTCPEKSSNKISTDRREAENEDRKVPVSEEVIR